VVCKVLGPFDKDLVSNLRSPKKCIDGEQYFKILVNCGIHKILNSVIHEKCLSENGEWEFTGERCVVGQHIDKKDVPQLDRSHLPKIESTVDDTTLTIINQSLFETLSQELQ
jgi:hypothetical protein